tara:strand:+ start:758 stop:1732 length:975 start_codon:yes stop_codon:yes gene_type:complete
MADKSFGVKELNLLKASGTPTIESSNNLSINAVNVAISTDVSIGGTCTATQFDGALGVWTLGANGTSDYTFTGTGLSGTVNDPALNLVRGQTYIFKNRSGGHPFRIQTSYQDTSGTAYNTGITNNSAANGTDLIFKVPQDAPNPLFYQCTAHTNMSGRLDIVGLTTALTATGIGSQPLYVDSIQGYGAGIRFSANILPIANNAYDIGSADKKVRDIYEDDSSDIVLKQDIVDYIGGLDLVNNLKVVNFTWKDGFYKAGQRETGLIAQNVKESLDKSSYESKDAWYTSSDGIQGLDKKRLIPALISAIQELTSRIGELEDELKNK